MDGDGSGSLALGGSSAGLAGLSHGLSAAGGSGHGLSTGSVGLGSSGIGSGVSVMLPQGILKMRPDAQSPNQMQEAFK